MLAVVECLVKYNSTALKLIYSRTIDGFVSRSGDPMTNHSIYISVSKTKALVFFVVASQYMKNNEMGDVRFMKSSDGIYATI